MSIINGLFFNEIKYNFNGNCLMYSMLLSSKYNMYNVCGSSGRLVKLLLLQYKYSNNCGSSGRLVN